MPFGATTTGLSQTRNERCDSGWCEGKRASRANLKSSDLEIGRKKPILHPNPNLLNRRIT
jgi:hypothetical protein